MDQRTALIEAVSLDDVQRVAKRLFNPDRLTIAVAGAPEASEGWRPITVADDD
jgi:predicted Zn-dependent peptidase